MEFWKKEEQAKMAEPEAEAVDPVICGGERKADIRFQDGGLPYAIGTKNIQVVRANRSAKGKPHEWTYNHAPMLAYWKGRFWIEYLSGPSGEHIPPSRTLLCWSRDGWEWSEPQVVFPPLSVDADFYRGPGRVRDRIDCIMHQRMGFYVSRKGRFLVLGFYGVSPTPDIAPNNGYGVGRVVREIMPDGGLSPIFFLRKNRSGGYCKEGPFPDYQESGDKGFQEACQELLEDRICRQQWWEEERLDRDFFGIEGGKAICCYTLPDGTAMGVCKNAMVTETKDNGESWKPFVKCPTLETSSGKVWGQRMPDGEYALVYNPTTDGAHRWPLALVCGEDGRHFGELLALTPEISPCRYGGILKNLGAQYVRGIWEGYPVPEDGGMWLTYSVNKEDIWTARVPVPIRSVWKGTVDENLDRKTVQLWNISSTKWASVWLEEKTGKPFLCMEDREPYDRPRAMRIFEKAGRLKLSTEVLIKEAPADMGLVIELQDGSGRVPIRLRFTGDGSFWIRSGGREDKAGNYKMDRWLTVSLEADCRENRFRIGLFQEKDRLVTEGDFSQSVYSLERVLFTTKTQLPWNTLEDSGRDGNLKDLVDSEEPAPAVSCCIRSLFAKQAESLNGG